MRERSKTLNATPNLNISSTLLRRIRYMGKPEIYLEPKARDAKIIELLEKLYPDAKTALNYNSPLEILVATMLSAQTTDVRVNIVTQTLFKKYKSPKDYADADIEELEQTSIPRASTITKPRTSKHAANSSSKNSMAKSPKPWRN